MVSAVVASLVGGVEDAPPAAEPAAPPAEVKYFILPFLPTMPRVARGAAAAAAMPAAATAQATVMSFSLEIMSPVYGLLPQRARQAAYRS
jgi:hypothetical protein